MDVGWLLVLWLLFYFLRPYKKHLTVSCRRRAIVIGHDHVRSGDSVHSERHYVFLCVRFHNGKRCWLPVTDEIFSRTHAGDTVSVIISLDVYGHRDYEIQLLEEKKS